MVDKILNTLQEFSKRRSDIGLNAVMAFFYIAQQCEDQNRIDGIPMQEVKGFLGDTSANTSRIIKTLAKFTAKRTSGLNVVETYESPLDGRHKLCKLTPKGKKLYEDLKLSMN